MKYALLDVYRSEEEFLPYFREIMNHNTSDNRVSYEFAVISEYTGEYIGFADIEIHLMNDNGGCAEIGYFLKPEYWGHGYASEIAATLIEICFLNLQLHRVTARCNSNNSKSEKVMLKAGMVKEGEFRKVRYKDGHWDNELHYSILIDDWKDKKLVLDK
jgi:Acetyltransferases, including N-acetylases of ribosomal proteins